MPAPVSFVFSPSAKGKADTVVAFVAKDNKLTASAEGLDKESGGQIAAYLKRQSGFIGKSGQTLVLAAAVKSKYARYILVGLGDGAKDTSYDYEVLGGKIYTALQANSVEQAVIKIDADKAAKNFDPVIFAAHLANGIHLKCYRFDQYRSKKKDEKPQVSLKKIEIELKSAAKSQALYKSLAAVTSGVFFARDLVNMPPNDLYPDSYAKRIAKELKPLGVSVEIIDEKRMKTLGFGAHLAVGQGSEKPPRVVIMEWNGLPQTKKTAPLALVGKGITFDTGGISIKPGASMDEMKMDMGGSAAVVGTLRALAVRKAKTHVIGIVALAENMPSDRAYRPGDIITSLSGKTIEVLNTDAEGRLVLCDSMTYVQKTYKPKVMIDLATLTGAIMVALGVEYCGAFVNDNTLWSRIEKAAGETGEKAWRMPLDETYRKAMESQIADLKNIADWSRNGGACTAAGFLQAFVENDIPWAHLDIAGTAYRNGDRPLGPRGGTGYGVRLLNNLIAEGYEN